MATLTTTNTDPTNAIENAIQAIRASAFDADARITIVTLMKIIRNVLISNGNDGNGKKYRTVRLDNSTFQARVGRVKGGLSVLEAVHFEYTKPNKEQLILSPMNENVNDLLEAIKRLNEEAIKLELGEHERPLIPSKDEIKCNRPTSSQQGITANARKHVNLAVEKIRASAFDIDAKITILTLMKMTRNILVTPSFDEKKRSIRISNPTFHGKVGRVRGGLNYLIAVGFEKNNTDDQRFTLMPERENKEILYEAMVRLNTEAVALEIPSQDRPSLPTKDEVMNSKNKTKEVSKAISSFDPYKTKIKRVTPQPRPGSNGYKNSGKSETEVKLERLQLRLKELLAKQKVPESKEERNIIVYQPGHGPSRGSLAKIARDMSGRNEKVGGIGGNNGKNNRKRGLTEAQMVMQTMKRRREAQERSVLFRTKAMREVEELENMKVYSSVILRIQFPDAWIIQANFSPGETVEEVIKFLKEYVLLEEFKKEESIYLYVTPPKELLDRSLTLARSKLQPAALVYIGCKTGGGKGIKGIDSLKPEIITLAGTSEENEGKIVSIPSSSSIHDDNDRINKGVKESKSGGGDFGSGGSTTTRKSGKGKKPKWLKT